MLVGGSKWAVEVAVAGGEPQSVALLRLHYMAKM